jgi:hypothetical protein
VKTGTQQMMRLTQDSVAASRIVAFGVLLPLAGDDPVGADA